MNRVEHLLFILSEECAEVAQRASKAARFGVNEVEPGQSLTNAERITRELHDVAGMVEMLIEAGIIRLPVDRSLIEGKKQKVEKFLAYSAECGTLTEEAPSKL